jgi:serine/threonine protein kinase
LKFLNNQWTSPEALLYGKFSPMSDVWSFGVVLWVTKRMGFIGNDFQEMLSYGEIPYSALTNKETVEKVKSGQILSKPANCPDELYNLMKGEVVKKCEIYF